MSNPESIQKVSYTHDAMIDMIVEKPTITQAELALNFGYTPGWVSQVINSDAFRERLAARKDDLVDPRIRMTLEDRIKGLVDTSLEILAKKLNDTQNMHVAVRVFDVGVRALGYGAKGAGAGVQINNYVALVPPKANNPTQWLEAHQPAARLAGQPVHSPLLEICPATLTSGPLDSLGTPVPDGS